MQQRLQITQCAEAHRAGLADPHVAASRRVKHPQRHFQTTLRLDVFEPAARYRLASLHQDGMDHYFAPIPGMPRVMDFWGKYSTLTIPSIVSRDVLDEGEIRL